MTLGLAKRGNWILKSCTRCHGDLHRDYEGEYYETEIRVCLQCGYTEPVKKTPKFEVQEPQFAFMEAA